MGRLGSQRSAVLRAGLRRKEVISFGCLRHDCAVLDSLRSSRAKRSSRALTLVWWRRMKQIQPSQFRPFFMMRILQSNTSAAEAEVSIGGERRTD
jgi:hypothetical protein